MLESEDKPIDQTNNLAYQIRTGLEYRVLELIALGYKKMYDTHHYDPGWKENKFTAILKNHIEGYCKNFSRLTKRNWYIDREYYHDSEDVINGEGDPDAVPRIDIIILTWTTDYEKVIFPFECKLLAENNTKLIRLYVEKGIIDRYLTEKNYSAGSNWGGMIGYILQGEHHNIVHGLNKQIDRQLKDSKSHLQIRQLATSLENIYESRHQNIKMIETLTIKHVFLSFTEQEQNKIS